MTHRGIALPTLAESAVEIDATRRHPHAAPSAAHRPHLHGGLPPAPRQPLDTGLPRLLLTELLLKVMHQHGLQHLHELAQHLKLDPALLEELFAQLRKERLVDVRLRGARDGDVTYELSSAGRERASDALARNLYSGPAPVSIDAYSARVQAQSIAGTGVGVSKERFAHVLADVAMRSELRDQLGAAMNSGGAAMLYGPPGAGKTYLCEQVARLLTGDIAVPYAVEVGGEIIRLFDPLVHRPARESQGPWLSIDSRQRTDARWVLCERPVVVTGGELTLEMLDLVFDPRAGYYQAPPHFKANNGLFLVDDLGRQLVTPRQLLNRWLLPMEQRHDYLMLGNGAKFQIPFDTQLFFSTNLPPNEVADDAFLRRIAYKIHVGPVDPSDYRRIMRDACATYGVHYVDAAFDHFVQHYHDGLGHPMLACYPRDLVRQIADYAAYQGCKPELSTEMLAWAWHNYFALHTVGGPRPIPASRTPETTP